VVGRGFSRLVEVTGVVGGTGCCWREEGWYEASSIFWGGGGAATARSSLPFE